MVMEWGNMVQYEQPKINMKIEDDFFFFKPSCGELYKINHLW